MPRTAGDFQLVRRRDTGGKATYYARFRGEVGELLSWKSTGHASKTAARAWAQRKIRQNEVYSTRATFAQYAESWWTSDHPYVQGRMARGGRLTTTYLVVMRGHLANHVLPYFKEKRLAQIKPRQIEDWILGMREEKLSPATINHALRCLKVMLKEALRQGIVSRDPSSFITGLAERQAGARHPQWPGDSGSVGRDGNRQELGWRSQALHLESPRCIDRDAHGGAASPSGWCRP